MSEKHLCECVECARLYEVDGPEAPDAYDVEVNVCTDCRGEVVADPAFLIAYKAAFLAAMADPNADLPY